MQTAIADSLKVLTVGNAPALLNISEATNLVTALCSLLSIVYTIYRFWKTGKDNQNNTDHGRRKEEKK